MKYEKKSNIKTEPELDVFVFIDRYPFKAVNNIITLNDKRQHNILIGIEPIKLSIKCSKEYFQIGIMFGTFEMYLGGRLN